MAYQALYRQWRPQTFSAMVGQEAVIATLRNQIMTGRIAHAYLFCGSRGTGKTSTAKIMARAINCLAPVQGDPCGQCESCLRLMGENSLDVLEIDAASNNGVDEIRDLRESVKYPPQYGKYKVYIIDEVHMLSASAFNALLKTLEEPPAHAVFILATTEPQRLPATILSRCQRFDFGRIPVQQIVGRLQEAVQGAGGTATDQALHLIARAAEGGMRDALSILDMCLGYHSEVTEDLVRNVLGTADRSFLFRFGEALRASDVKAAMAMIDELMRGGREPVVFSKDVSQHLRALLMAQSCGEELAGLLELTQEDAEEYRRQAQGFTDERLLRMLELFMAVETEMRWASSPRIALEAATMKACLKTKDTDAAALNERIAELEQQLSTLTEQLKNGSFTPAKPAARSAAPKTSPTPHTDKPAAPAPLTPTGKTPGEAWKAMMDALKRSDPATYSFLTQGRFAGCDGNVYRWYAKPGQDFYVASLNSPAKRDSITAALGQALGMEVTFQASPEPTDASPDAMAAENTLLAELKESFGGENVTVQEKEK